MATLHTVDLQINLAWLSSPLLIRLIDEVFICNDNHWNVLSYAKPAKLPQSNLGWGTKVLMRAKQMSVVL